MKKAFLPFVSIVSIIISQLSTLIVYFLFSKGIAGQVSTIIVWSTFISQVIFFGGDQSLLRRLLQKEENTRSYRAAQSLYFTLSLLLPSVLVIIIISFCGIDSLFSIGTLSIVLFSLLKWYELVCKVEGRFDAYVYSMLIVSILLLSLYLLSWVSGFLLYDALVVHRVIVIFALLTIIRKQIRTCFKFFTFSGWFGEFSKDLPFFFLLLLSFTNVFFDKLYLSVVVGPDVYAEYGLLIAAYGLMIQPKTILSNQFLSLINTRTEYYFDKVRTTSVLVTILIGLVGGVFYWLATRYMLNGYVFLILPYIILFLSAVAEAFFGPAGMILSYKFSPKYNIVAELVGFTILLVAVVALSSVNEMLPMNLISCVAAALALAKVVVASLKLIILKKIETVNE